jgi:tetrahydromethanopterin S-methyltransferase subunit F
MIELLSGLALGLSVGLVVGFVAAVLLIIPESNFQAV